MIERREREEREKERERKKGRRRYIERKNYDAITMNREIITGNYDSKLSASLSMTQKMWEL